MKNVVVTDKAPAAIGPYSQAIEINGMIYTSGVIPIDPVTGTIDSNIEGQVEQVFSNMSHLLEAAGSNFDKVVKTTVFIKDMNQFSIINDIYKKYFTQNYPARSCVEVARLPKDVLIEVEAVAYK